MAGEAKRELRRRIRARLGSLTPESRARASERLAARLRPHLSGRVLLYAALPDEIDLSPLLAEREVILPRVRGEELVLHRVQSALVTGPWGLAEPHEEDPAVALTDIDVVVVPGRAFDASGGRLGRGRGFYDRLLTTTATRIGVGFDEQIVEAVPMEPHDRRMHRVLTPSWDFVVP